jgi:DNA-binding NarL/FixJ family response regulator
MEGTEEALERKLRDAQAAVVAAREATRLRQEAVAEARRAGWSKYRIAAVLGVERPTVDSIIKAIERAAESSAT